MPGILGIDLGTTNSCVALVESGTPLVVPVDNGHYLFPSVVAYREDGRYLVGRLAKRQSVVNAENTVFASKRLLGLPFDNEAAQRIIATVPYRCVAGAKNDIRVSIFGKNYALPEISALILGELKRAAEEHFGTQFRKAVITVPAYFNDLQRQATRDAGSIAGLEVLRILNEPTAAALAYGLLNDKRKDRHVAVYDLGGGTFDVSVMSIRESLVEVLATAGDPFLGGRDFDDRIIDWLTVRIEREHGVNLYQDRNAMQRLREAAEVAKIELSDRVETRIALPFLATSRSNTPIHIDYTLTRVELQTMSQDLIDRTVRLFQETIQRSGLSMESIDDIVMVGGMTRMPAVQKAVETAAGKRPSSGVHPDLVVAVGAAIHAGDLSEDGTTRVLLDVTPHNLGIAAVGGLAETVIEKDTAIPTESKRIFTTVRDNQDIVRIVVFQGEHRQVQKNQVLGEFMLQNIRPGPRGSVRIEVSFYISRDGTVSVAAQDLDTHEKQSIQISGSPTLEEDELRRMISDHQDQLLAALEHVDG